MIVSHSLQLPSLTADRLKDDHNVILDQYLQYLQYLQHNKSVAGVETPAEHCEALNSLPDTAAVSSLNAVLSDLEGLRNGSESLILTGMEKTTQDYICGRYKNTDLSTTTPEEGEDTKTICISLLF